MKLNKKKELAARTLGVGKNRISFNINQLNEIKEAITKQDIIDLHSNGAIIINEIRGRRTLQKRRTRRMFGSRRKNIIDKKLNYMTLTRKLRKHIAPLKREGALSRENFISIRKEIRAGIYRNLAQLKEKLKETK